MRKQTPLLVLSTLLAVPLMAADRSSTQAPAAPPVQGQCPRMSESDAPGDDPGRMERPALSPAESTLVATLAPHRDSMQLAMRDYRRKRDAGKTPEQLPAELARIAQLKSRIDSIETKNLAVWLDMRRGGNGEGFGPARRSHRGAR